MARTRGAKSSSPSSRLRIPKGAPVQDSTSEPPRPRPGPPPVKSAPTSSPARRYNTRRSLTIAGTSSSRRPPKKKAKVSEPIDLTESSLEPESEPTPSPPPAEKSPPPAKRSPRLAKKSPPPAKRPQPSQAPARESQIPSDMTPEEAIRRPMVTQPPIAGNLDCRARPFHSELCFDIATFRIQPELRESFRMLQRYRMEHLLTPRDFFYPRVAMDFYQSMTTNRVSNPTAIHFTIDGRHGILGARHIAEALHIPYEPTRPGDFRRRGVLLEALFRISEGYFFGPHHLILAALLYFEEKILEHLGYPTKPQHERKRFCREIFTLDKWTSMTTYGEQPEEPVEPPADTQPPALAVTLCEPPPEVPSSAPQATLQPPPVIPLTSAPSPSAEPRITALRSQQEQILATQAQHTAILRQIQHHLGIISAPEHPMPHEEPPTGEAVEPSFPQHHPPTI
ncbi:hypothetical protein AAG906_013053 [Vitis piasezkii]